jgi:hypothetical protein
MASFVAHLLTFFSKFGLGVRYAREQYSAYDQLEEASRPDCRLDVRGKFFGWEIHPRGSEGQTFNMACYASVVPPRETPGLLKCRLDFE